MMRFLNDFSRTSSARRTPTLQVSAPARRTDCAPIESLPWSGLVGLFPRGVPVWTSSSSLARRDPWLAAATESPDSVPIDLTYSFSWEDKRHFLSGALLREWALRPVGEDEHGALLYPVHVVMSGAPGTRYYENIVCGAAEQLARNEMIIGRPSPLAVAALAISQ